MTLLWWIISAVVPILSGLAGVIVGARLTSNQQQSARKYNFVERQVREFYSPLLGMRQRILAESELRLKISNIANEEWQSLCRNRTPEQLQKLDFEPFRRIIGYNNLQLSEELLPAYRKMLEIFTSSFWLAEEATRQHYAALVEYVEIWNRFMKETLPAEVLHRLEHSEQRLHPLYADLEQQLGTLRSRLSQGRA
jgi:hypothetical protein